jgi:thioredoxin 1
MASVLQQVAHEIKDKARILKVNVDRNPDAANKLGIRGVPTFIIFKNGKEMWRHSGTIDKSSLIDQALRFSN